MCGIVGVLGDHEVSPLILDALKRLEYRGYDSAGIATVNRGKLDRRRAVGKLINLSDTLVHDPLPGRVGIGHTRWATHGGPSVANAHPHRAGRVAVVHNGIIENFRVLRDELTLQGAEFSSETDTETIVQLTSRYLDQGMTPVQAARATLKRLEGAFALAFLFDGEEDLIICARRGSPLCIGHGAGEMYLGSDAIALAEMTDRITYLEEGDWAILTRAGAQIFDAEDQQTARPMTRINVDTARVDKAGHRHFMAKEMAEQPAVLKAAMDAYAAPKADGIDLPEGIAFAKADRLIMVACGTAFYACQVAKYWFERYAGLAVELDIASEFRYRDPVLGPSNLALFVSQSGETADTLAALRHARPHVAQVLSVVNVPTSSIARESDVALPIHAGPEIGVASTKAFTAQLQVLAMLALKAGLERGFLSAEAFAARVAELRMLPGFVAQALDREEEIRRMSEALAQARDVLFLGRGVMYPLALEGALKLKEISYIHAEAYAAGELKHGPIALIDTDLPVIVFAPYDALFDKTVSNMQEVMARQGKVLLISDAQGLAAAGDVPFWLQMPTVPDFIAPIVYAVPAQLIAYHTALHRGTDVDQPRNLAKSVTVE
ncbi:glutamine--fructose-6-phosphate transaminase (isomerizing) [Roseinatronobacter bogoriensis]|uniref:Glutamine--fructose-6-phosphate aminotransferase [isomerizing] n=1 Tax=Roseinatronobacter bogoriensis subsp. barguzinensis TaxID=441209 RepID=A0A2K8KBD3_9RHOB|nr:MULTISPECIES: glutamine--fructose-6-phosphate transaminase (isomerizing) [Rhodobaca]ATX66724.1 glutamine--fructose-6-phosphate transaminase (isomerizing) [Rhodobaca barguzinensis]MBB4206181.1 glucosamine--fructose-6-phosphate aminotransferase (isomerizing) [Rhodobaca bogoriensis DSM 18756]TDW40925.1 glutamine--fructose-6-phosphate transaminase [Rhodobaca barguzinensis]TDY74897.1 glutamine--fructose-6-phosphate transaminase [Rhodobaca bogoriensis DSM 18756]